MFGDVRWAPPTTPHCDPVTDGARLCLVRHRQNACGDPPYGDAMVLEKHQDDKSTLEGAQQGFIA